MNDSILTIILTTRESKARSIETNPKIIKIFDDLSRLCDEEGNNFFSSLVEMEKREIKKDYELTILSVAVLLQKVSIVSSLVKAGIEVNETIRDAFTQSALYTAFEIENIEIAEILLQAGADPNLFIPISRAIEKSNSKLVQLAISYGARLKFDSGYQPLEKAAMNCTVDIVKQLIDAGCDVNPKYDKGFTPLSNACQRANIEIVKLLLESGANPNQPRPSDGVLSIILACLVAFSHGWFVELKVIERDKNIHLKIAPIVKLLIDFGAEVNVRDLRFMTPLMIAAEYGYSDVAEVLVRSGADINLEDKQGKTALSIASKKGHLPIVQLLNTNY
jgi:ankyrin repeat protein